MMIAMMMMKTIMTIIMLNNNSCIYSVEFLLFCTAKAAVGLGRWWGGATFYISRVIANRKSLDYSVDYEHLVQSASPLHSPAPSPHDIPDSHSWRNRDVSRNT